MNAPSDATTAVARRASRSRHVDIRGLRQHLRSWGDPQARPLLLLHGWMDVSAAFQFTVDALVGNWHVLAPDWRGFGASARTEDAYWFPDYFADLDAWLDVLSPDAPIDIVGHSMGGNIAGIYAGVRPERVRSLVLAEGFGLPATQPAQAPQRIARWLDQLREAPGWRPYADLDAVAAKLRDNNPRLDPARAAWLAPHWAEVGADGLWRPAADARHKWTNPVLYRVDEAIACWRRITCPTLWLWGGSGEWVRQFADADDAEWERRRGAFAHLREATIAESGHMMHLDQPEAFAAAIEAFVTPVPLPPPSA
ncbi:MAG: alpha/beta hydrolase [Burkholderiales bacterium]|jgi:pimeloyl-ACP methyl ester carboxylesterase|nr:alpha/beta hydrolase [Burkholderiales bacterium]